MYDKNAVIVIINHFISELNSAGYSPDEVFLFGSYAKGNPHKFSDIDVAVWDSKFSGCLPLDIENMKSILSKFSSIELHTFNSEDKDSPIISEIKTNGIRIY
ncbi:MAG: nucleotidyltransferase domain-containing protein [Bacteroidales bacterium]|nr:nucleotidyltransferase domain-containing protein [Bacteroidales bacterium]